MERRCECSESCTAQEIYFGLVLLMFTKNSKKEIPLVSAPRTCQLPWDCGGFSHINTAGILLGQNINELSSKEILLSLAFCSRKAVRTRDLGHWRFNLHWMDGWIEILLEPQDGYGFFSSMINHGLSLCNFI